MSQCRLCLGGEHLICTFDSRLSNAQELRACVLLCTGVEIKSTDPVTKMVCRSCLKITGKLIKFRATAIANDRALKEQVGQECVTHLRNPDDVAKLHESILAGMSDIDVDESIAQIFERVAEKTRSSVVCAEVNKRVLAADDLHPSIERLLEIYPKLALTDDDVQKLDVAPALILDKSEADEHLGRLQYSAEAEAEAEVEKISSLNEQYYNLSSRLENAEENVPASLDSHGGVPHELYCRSSYYTDPDYYVFKRRKRKFDEVSDGSYSDTGGSDSETDETQRLMTRSSKYKFTRVVNCTNSDSDSELLGFSKANSEEVRVCEYCDKMCHSRSQLRHHERTHRKCQVCHKVFRTDDALDAHLMNVCYKKIEESHQPFLQMMRIDDHPLVVKQYQSAFEYFFSRMNDETYEGYGKRDENPAPDENFPLYHTEGHVASESAYVTDAFKKFQSVRNVPVKRNKTCQTRKSDVMIKYSSQNQIILRDLFSDLLTYKVPIQMVVDQKISAHISYTTKPTLNRTMHNWSELNAIDVAMPPKLLNLSSTPVLHFSSPTTSVIKTVANRNLPAVRPRIVQKNKAGTTRTVASSAAVKVASNSGATPTPPNQIYNITSILTTTKPQTATKTASSPVPIKREEEEINTGPNSCRDVVFKIPFNPSRPASRCESSSSPSLIKEELPDVVGANENNSKRPAFRYPYSSNPQNRMYQNQNVYPPQNQYLIPVNSQQKGPRNLNLGNLLLLKNSGAPPTLHSPARSNGSVFFPSTLSPVPPTISSPVNTVAPFFDSSKASLPYPPLNTYSVPPEYEAINTAGGAFPPENPYNARPYHQPPSNPYPPNGFRSNSAPYASDAYPSNYAQYIPPYNPMREYGFNDGRSMHLLQPQHLGTSAVGGKVFLRVKQPWEINQK